MTTSAAIRAYANLPAEVPEALLVQHCAIAAADVAGVTGHAAAPAGHEVFYGEAVTVRALVSVLPWLNTFALDGAAKVGRLEGSVEARFLDADEVSKLIKRLSGRYAELIAAIPVAASVNPTAGFGGIFLATIGESTQ